MQLNGSFIAEYPNNRKRKRIGVANGNWYLARKRDLGRGHKGHKSRQTGYSRKPNSKASVRQCDVRAGSRNAVSNNNWSVEVFAVKRQ